MSRIRSRTPIRSVRQLPGNEDPPLPANLHPGKPLVEPRNRPPHTLDKRDRLRIAQLDLAVGVPLHLAVLIHNRLPRMIVGGVELAPVIRAPVGPQPPGVVNLVNLARLRVSAGTDFDVLVA